MGSNPLHISVSYCNETGKKHIVLTLQNKQGASDSTNDKIKIKHTLQSNDRDRHAK